MASPFSQNPGMNALGDNMAQRAQEQANFKALVNEMEGTAQMFSMLSKTCFAKCVPRFKDAELGVGELSCIDRCTMKFMATAHVVATTMQKMNGA